MFSEEHAASSIMHSISHSQVYFFSCVISLFAFRLVFREDYDSPLVFLSATYMPSRMQVAPTRK